MKQLFCTLLFLCSLSAFAQKEREVSLKNVRGEFALTANMDITMKEAKEQARNVVRRKAIEQVCGQRINIWDKIELSSAGETYNSLSIVQTDGEIVEFEVVDEGQKNSEVRSGEFVFYCVANVKVKKGLSPDPNFSAKVEGIRSVYYENEALNFTIQSLQNCYLTIFLFENQETGYQLYPSYNDNPKPLIANQKYDYPQVDEWFITKETQQQVETNQLVFVFTKTECSFYRDVTSRAEIEKWMMKIPADQKFIYVSAFDIRDK